MSAQNESVFLSRVDIKSKMIKIAIFGMVTVFAVILVSTAFAQEYHVHHTTILLNPIPSTIAQGQPLTFSGSLTSDGNNPVPNRTIFIEYDSPYGCTRILGVVSTDTNGNFALTWNAVPKHQIGGTYYLFANFNGDDSYLYSFSKIFPLAVAAQSTNLAKDSITQVSLLYEMAKDQKFRQGFTEQVVDGLGGCNGN